MGFDQAYYTSCEQGLSNQPGYQFNAVTPGARPETLTEVEAITAYSPPSSVPYSAGAEEIARSPINLCYRPGRCTILANVVFVGNDYSHRFGNYFAHALITDDPVHELGNALPIQLWRAPFWANKPVTSTPLPPLTLPSTDTTELSRAAVAEFIGNHASADRIAALVTAAGLAVTKQERKVVIVERSADEVARWIAAVSYLLPSELVHRMSFATYEHQPRYSALNMVGTVPEAEFQADEGAFETNFVFDMTADRAVPLDPHPLAELLADIGVEAATEAWSRARELAAGNEDDLDDWHPVLAATIVGKGLGYAEDAAAVADWLGGNADRLGTDLVTEIGRRVLPLLLGADEPSRQLSALATAARTVHAVGLAEDVELVQIETMLDGDVALLDSSEPIRSPRARSAAQQALDRRLRLDTGNDAIDLLRWARQTSIEVSPSALRHAGVRRIGPAVIAAPDDDAVRPLLLDWPELAEGVVDHLADASGARLGDVVSVLLGPLGDLLDIGGRPQLREAAAVTAVRSDDLSPTDALIRIVRDRGVLRDGLLDMLWPTGAWTAADACDVVLRIDPALIADQRLMAWLIRALTAGAPSGGTASTDPFDRLCDAVAMSPAFEQLPMDLRHDVQTRRDILLLVEGLLSASHAEFMRLLDDLEERYQTFGQDKRTAVAHKLVEGAGQLGSIDFAFLLASLRHVRDTYFQVLASARDRDQAVRMMATLLGALGELKRLHATHKSLREPRREIEAATDRLLRTWRRREIRQVIDLLKQQRLNYMAWWLANWLMDNPGGGFGRLANMFGKRTDPPPMTRPGPRKKGR